MSVTGRALGRCRAIGPNDRGCVLQHGHPGQHENYAGDRWRRHCLRCDDGEAAWPCTCEEPRTCSAKHARSGAQCVHVEGHSMAHVTATGLFWR